MKKSKINLRIVRWKRSLSISLLFLLFLTGCTMQKNEIESERTDVPYTIVEVREIPQALMEVIEENKHQEMRFSYEDEDSLYLVRGYGRQSTGGYSIAVTQCSEDETTMWFDTRLLGPEDTRSLAKEPSFPYLVIKTEGREKEIMIQ